MTAKSNRSHYLNSLEQQKIWERFRQRNKSAPLYEFFSSVAEELNIPVRVVRRFVKGRYKAVRTGGRSRDRRVATRRRSSRGIASRVH